MSFYFKRTITAILSSQNLNYHLLKSVDALTNIIFTTVEKFAISDILKTFHSI